MSVRLSLLLFVAPIFLSTDKAAAQPGPVYPDSLTAWSRWSTIGTIVPRIQAIRYATGPIRIDGRPDDMAWQAIDWSEPFVDIEGSRKPEPPHLTRMKVLWDSTSLYVTVDMTEPHLWGTITDSTKVIWHDNDFEVFIDPDGDGHDYFELEINSLNVSNEVYFSRAYGDGEISDRNAWFDGLVSRVHLRGTLNDRRDVDDGWSMEIAMPWTGFTRYGTDGLPPNPGDRWRMNFSRVNWDLLPDSTKTGYIRNGPEQGHNWVWTPQGIILMHIPEMWGFMEFRLDDQPPTPPSSFYTRARTCLHDAYYRNLAFRGPAGRQARSLSELYGSNRPSEPCSDMIFEARAEGFLIRMVDPEEGQSASIDYRRHFSIPATDEMSSHVRD